MMNLLLKKGADVNVTDKDGVTTIMSAASHGHAQVPAFVGRGGVLASILLSVDTSVIPFYFDLISCAC